jgi:hypothetical protein
LPAGDNRGRGRRRALDERDDRDQSSLGRVQHITAHEFDSIQEIIRLS